MSTTTRKRLLLGVRVAISAALLALLITQIPDLDSAELVPRRTATTWAWLAGAVAATLTGFVLSAMRWKQVLHAIDLDTPLPRLLGITLAGQFISNFVPSTVGGDVLRVSRLARSNGDRPGTFASVVLERLSGWVVLPLLSATGFAVNSGLRQLGRATGLAVTVAIVTVVALCALLGAAAHPRLGGRWVDNPLGAGGWRRFLASLHLGLQRLRHHPTAGFNVLAAGVAYALVLTAAAFMAARVIGIDQVGPTAILAFFPAVLILQTLPLGIAGLGIREGAFVLFLDPLGVPPEKAIALGLLLYVMTLGSSVLGAPTFAVGGGPIRQTAEVAA